VHLIDRVQDVGSEDALVSPLQATVLQGARRAVALGLAVGEQYAERTGLVDLKRTNLEGALPSGKGDEFAELLTAEALVVLYVFERQRTFGVAWRFVGIGSGHRTVCGQ